MQFSTKSDNTLPGYIGTRKIKIIDDSQICREYSIQFADTNYISHSEHENRKYHSVIFAEPEHQLVSVFPKIPYPSSEILDKSEIPPYTIQEIIEGIRLHMFYDYRAKEWVIATRRVIGGDHYPVFDGEIVSNSTYKQMFLDAVPDMFSPVIVDILSKTHSYHFILQHPKLPQTAHIPTPAVYLIDIFSIDPITNTATLVKPGKSPIIPLGVLLPKYILLSVSSDPDSKQFNYSTVPIVYSDMKTLKTAIDIVGSSEFEKCNHPGWYVRSWDTTIPFHDQFDCILENAKYKNMRILKQSGSKYYLWKYLTLLKQNAVNDFIRWNPYFAETSRRMYSIYHDFQKEVYSMYLNIYVKKTIPALTTMDTTNISDRMTAIFKSYARDIHYNVYLPRVRYHKKNKYPKDSVDLRIKMKDVDNYMRKLKPDSLVKSILGL